MKKLLTKINTNLLIAVTATALLTLSSQANASLITLSTAYSAAAAQTNANAYKSIVSAAIASPTSGYGMQNLSDLNNISNHGLFGSNSNIAFDFEINFNVSAIEAGNWAFRAGVDFGKGGAVFVDGNALGYKTNDMWWGGSYSNPSQFFNYTTSLSAGNHTLSIYGLEGCCDGGTQTQFHGAKSTAFMTFSSADGINPIPEPATIGLLGLGLLGMASMRRKS